MHLHKVDLLGRITARNFFCCLDAFLEGAFSKQLPLPMMTSAHTKMSLKHILSEQVHERQMQKATRQKTCQMHDNVSRDAQAHKHQQHN